MSRREPRAWRMGEARAALLSDGAGHQISDRPLGPRTGFGAAERILAFSGAALFLVMLGLFHFIRIDGAVIALGQAAEASAPAQVQSPRAGLLGQVMVRDGDRVAAGEVLARLDPALLEARRALLRDRLEELRSRRDGAESGGHGALAPTATTEATAAYEAARLELARLTTALDRLEIRAPLAGVVGDLQGHVAGQALTRGETLLSVAPLPEPGVFELEVTPRAMSTVHMGQPVRMHVPALASRLTSALEGRITAIAPEGVRDPATGHILYRVAVTIPPEQLARMGAATLRPGMPVQAFLQTGRRSILSYLLQPLSVQLLRAFREG